MSLDNFMSGMIGAAGTVAVGVMGYFAQRHSRPTQKAQDFATIVQGFNKLVGDLQKECTRLSREVGELHGVVEVLCEHIDNLEGTMRIHGVPVPARPKAKGG